MRDRYRTLARAYHPDLNENDAVSAEEFRRIASAYDVLKRWFRRPPSSRTGGPTKADDERAPSDAWWRQFGDLI